MGDRYCACDDAGYQWRVLYANPQMALVRLKCPRDVGKSLAYGQGLPYLCAGSAVAAGGASSGVGMSGSTAPEPTYGAENGAGGLSRSMMSDSESLWVRVWGFVAGV